MKKTKRLLLTAFTALALSLNLTLTVNADISGFEDSCNLNVYNQNDNLSNNENFFEEKNGKVHEIEKISVYYTVDYMVDSSENITNADLGISDEYKLKKIKAKGCNIFRVEVKDETEMNKLFDQAKSLCDNKKIQNAYTLHVKSFSPAFKSSNGEYKADSQGDWWLGFLRNYYIYNEQMVDDSIILGDSDGDFDLDVRDCSFIAKNLANNETDEINEKADFNSDNDIDVRDAAALAKHLAAK